MEGLNLDDGFVSERRHVTVLFADISDSTRLVKGLDPEDAMAILSPTIDLMVDVVRQHEGTIVKIMGDGILAIFGAPVALEKHAARACFAAIAMQVEIDARQKATRHSQLADVHIHSGIATGEVVAGILGADPRAAYDAVGYTIHLASYLQELAPSGTIYVSESTHALIKQQLECELLGPMKIRGVADPIQTYRLIFKGHDTRARLGSHRKASRSALIGRDEELALLNRKAELLLEDEGGGIVSIVGEAGIGKSHLLAAFRASAVKRGMVWLEGAALSYGRSLGYWPFLEILHSYTGITEEDTVVDQWRKLSERIERLFAGDVAEVLPYIASLLGVNVSEEYQDRVKYLDSEAMRRQIFRSMRLLVERQTQQEPTILVFEDAFWMDLSSAALLSHLMPLVKHSRILICMVTREDIEGAQWWSAAQQFASRYSGDSLGASIWNCEQPTRRQLTQSQ